MIDPKFLKINPIEQSETIPSNWYQSPEIFDIEKERIFSKSWQLVGAESGIPNPGDSRIADIGNNPIMVVRQSDKSIKAFFNVCQHRGGPLLRENGCNKTLQCKYHGWVYDLNGTLKKTREFDGVENFTKKDYNLKPIRIDVWMGLIFVNLSNQAPELSEHLSGITSRIAPIDFSKYSYHSRESYAVQCNWKVYMDNFLEGYHIPFVHPQLNEVMDYKSYRTELSDQYSLQWCPLDSELSPYGKTDLGDDTAYYFTIFPNILLNIAPGRIQTNIIEPKSPISCTIHFDYFFTNPNDAQIEKDFEFSDLVQKEDIQICEDVQKGLTSKGYDTGRISVHSESGLYHFQSLIKQYLSNG